MKERFYRLVLIAGLSTLLSATASTDAPADYGTCIACHGAQGEGNSSLGGPALAGQSADYLVRQLTNFQSGLRGTAPDDTRGNQMVAVAALLNDDSKQQIAEYLATLPRVKPVATLDGDVAAGRGVYNSNCSDCHGAQGEGNSALSAPRLAGLGDQYLFDQFKKFQRKQRGYAPADKRGRQMQFMSDVITDDASLTNVVTYIQTLTGTPQ